MNGEIKNIEEVFKENGYTEDEIKEAMNEKKRPSTEKETEQPSRGIVVIQNIPNITPQFNKIAREHGFKVANKSGTRVKDLTAKAKIPLGTRIQMLCTTYLAGATNTPIQGRHTANGRHDAKNIKTKYA